MKNKTRSHLKKLTVLMLLVTSVITGCSINGNLTGPNQTAGQVTFSITQRQGINGGTEFMFKPSVSTKLSKVVSKFPEQQYEDVINNPNPNYTFSKDSTYSIREYLNVTAGQQWKFEFANTGTPNFDVTTDYTVQ